MKKISLKNLNLNEVEQLSREQLKNVMGGLEAGSGNGSCVVPCSYSGGLGNSCVTTDCKPGTCRYATGTQWNYGCWAN